MPKLPIDTDILVTVGPLIDSDDARTREEAVPFNAPGMAIDIIFEDLAGGISTTAVVPTSGGLHDWSHLDQGNYSVAIPAAGGTFDNDTAGLLQIVGFVNGILPFESVVYTVG